MRELIASTDRITAAVARAVVAEWDEIDLPLLAPSLRAIAIQRFSSLRGAFRDLAATAVPGVSQCKELFDALGADAAQRRFGAESLIARALRSAVPPEPEPGIELEHALALELMHPVGVADGAARCGSLAVRFGRESERLTLPSRGEAPIEHRLDLRGRVALFDEAGPFLAAGITALRARPTPATRSLLVAVFLAPAAESEVESAAKSAIDRCERLFRRPANRCTLAIAESLQADR